MKRLQTLQLFLEKEEKKRDEAQAGVRAAYRQVEAQQAQADGLTGYRAEYVQKWSKQFAAGSSMEILRCYQGFMSRLDQAITQQQAVVAHAQRGVEIARQRLQEREIRVATVQRLIKRRRDLLAKIADRREQKNLDEMAQRRSPARALAGMG